MDSARADGTSSTRVWAPSRTMSPAADHRVPDVRGGRGEDGRLGAQPRQGARRADGVQRDRGEVRERARLQAARVGQAERRMTVGGGGGQQGVRRPVAPGAAAQALVQLHRAGLFEQVDHGVAVAAQGQRAARLLEADRGADAVGEVAFGGGAHAGAGGGAAEEGDVPVGEVGVVDAGGPRPQHPVVGEELGGGAAVRRLAGVVLGGLLREVDVQRRPALLGPLGDGGQLVGGHGAHRVDRGADQGVLAGLEGSRPAAPRPRRCRRRSAAGGGSAARRSPPTGTPCPAG